MTFKKMTQELETIIESAYTEGVTVDEAEKLAARFLHAQLKVSEELRIADLDSRTRKSGVKAIRAALYTNIRSGPDKVTEAAIEAQLNANDIVEAEQKSFDEAEVNRDELERLYNVYINCHIYFRGVAKGSF